MRKPKYTDEEMLAVLRACGHIVPADQWYTEKRSPSVGTYCSRFESWSRAWELAGYDVSNQRKWPTERYDNETMLDQLRTISVYIPITQWRKENRKPSAELYWARFGTWENAWTMAGIIVPSRPERLKQQTIDTMQRVGRYMTTTEWQAAGFSPSTDYIWRLFGSWRAAWEQAGVCDPNVVEPRGNDYSSDPHWNRLNERERYVLQERHHGKTLEAIGETLRLTRERVRQIEKGATDKLTKWVERSPERIKEELLALIKTHDQYVPANHWAYKKPSVHTIVKYFGSWKNAWRAAGIEPQETRGRSSK